MTTEVLLPAATVVVVQSPNQTLPQPQPQAQAQPQPQSQPQLQAQQPQLQPQLQQPQVMSQPMLQPQLPPSMQRMTLAEAVYRDEQQARRTGCCRVAPHSQRTACTVGSCCTLACLLLGLILLGIWIPEASRSCDKGRDFDCLGPALATIAITVNVIVTAVVVLSCYGCYRSCCPRTGKVCVDEWACYACRGCGTANGSGRGSGSAIEPDHPCYDALESCESGACCLGAQPVVTWDLRRPVSAPFDAAGAVAMASPAPQYQALYVQPSPPQPAPAPLAAA